MHPRCSDARHLSSPMQSSSPSSEGDWFLRADCPTCSGYRLALRVPDPEKRLLAEVRASAFLEGVHAMTLPRLPGRRPAGAASLPPRTSSTSGGTPTRASGWAPCRTMADASMPLGVRSYWARQEARAAARAMRESGPLPLRVAAEPAEVDDDSCTVFYDMSSGRWRLRVACFDCGGFELRLAALGRGNVETAAAEALRCLDRIGDEGCPHCRSEHERTGSWEASSTSRASGTTRRAPTGSSGARWAGPATARRCRSGSAATTPTRASSCEPPPTCCSAAATGSTSTAKSSSSRRRPGSGGDPPPPVPPCPRRSA